MKHIPVCRPLLPTTEKLRPYLEKIDSKRYYSNIGPLTSEFEEKLADHFGVATNQVVTSANGTLALVQALKAFNVRSGSFCIMPSWTFTATPAAAIMAGLVPYFVDVDQTNWMIQPKDIFPLLKKHDISAVIPVAPFGAPVDMAAWEQFQNTTGIPVIIDAAAGFDSFSAAYRKTKVNVSFMVSLHATKVIGIGEGALLITSNDDLAKNMRMQGNFGFHNSRESILPGINAKISEYAAAIGLAALNEWAEKQKSWQQLSHQFETQVKRIASIECAPFFNQGWVSSYGLIKLKAPYTADQIKTELEKNNIGSLLWWGKGCHKQKAYQNYLHTDMSVTEHLADHVLGLPFWLGLTEMDLITVFNHLEKILSSTSQSKFYV